MIPQPAEISALMAALRLAIIPDDAKALADLRWAAPQMQSVYGETVVRRRFREAVQIYCADPAPANLAALTEAMNAVSRGGLLPGPTPPEDLGRIRRHPGTNGVAAAQPRDPDDLFVDR